MKILYLDESGDSNLSKIDPSYPIFILGGGIVDKDDCKYNKELMDKFKLKYWGRTDIILHSSEINKQKNDFKFLLDKTKRLEFMGDINNLMIDLKYKVIACIIDIRKIKEKYGEDYLDPYEYGLRILLEKFIYEMSYREEGILITESRGKIKDKQISLAFETIKNQGTKFIKGKEITDKIISFFIRSKKVNYTGLQIADLVLSPIGRKYIKKRTNLDHDIVCSKLCKNKQGNIHNFGLTIKP